MTWQAFDYNERRNYEGFFWLRIEVPEMSNANGSDGHSITDEQTKIHVKVVLGEIIKTEDDWLFESVIASNAIDLNMDSKITHIQPLAFPEGTL